VDPVTTYVDLTGRGKRIDGGHLWQEILMLLLVWQLVESVERWHNEQGDFYGWPG
jgi:hypothetical protein